MHGAPRALALDKRHGYEQSRDSHERDIDKFKIFGYYCLVLGVVVIIAGIVEKVR